MASSPTYSSSSSVPETEVVFEEELEFSEANNLLLMALMEEPQEDDQDDDKLMSMIQSLEAEIGNQRYDHHMGQVDRQDCSTSSLSVCPPDDYWINMEVASASFSSSPFDEDMIMMSAWSPCAVDGDDDCCNYGVWLEN